MNCESRTAHLQEYMDGQMTTAETQAVEDHLATCAACRAELALLMQVDEALAQMPGLPEPKDMTAQVMARVRASTLAQPVPAFRLHWEDAVVSAASAWAAVAALAVLFVFPAQGATPPQVLLQQTWWTWSARIDRLWHTLQLEPVHVLGALSGLCMAAALAASAVVLTRQCPAWKASPS